MNIEQQVVSLELAKKMKELGFPQESLFKWHSKINDDGKNVHTELVYFPTEQMKQDYSAYTVAELGEILKEIDHPVPYWCSQQLVKSWCMFKNKEAYDIQEANEANARAKCLIYLAENNLINPKDITL